MSTSPLDTNEAFKNYRIAQAKNEMQSHRILVGVSFIPIAVAITAILGLAFSQIPHSSLEFIIPNALCGITIAVGVFSVGYFIHLTHKEHIKMNQRISQPTGDYEKERALILRQQVTDLRMPKA